MFWKPRTKHRLLLFLLIVFVFSQIIIPRPVYATVPTVVVENLPDKIKEIITTVALSTVVNAASFFMRRLAYDAAVYVASGGKGQGSLIFNKPFDEYLLSVGGDTLGEAIQSLGEGFGVDLCAPPNLQFQASLKISLDRIYNIDDLRVGAKPGPQPSCSWNQFKNNWFQDGKLVKPDVSIDAAADFAGELNIAQTDFGYALGSIAKLDRLQEHVRESKSLERLEGRGFKTVSDLISGNVKTPAAIVEEETTALTAKHQGTLSTQQIAGIYGAGLWQVVPMSMSVFLNTLTSKLLDQVLNKGLVPSEADGGLAGGFYDVVLTSKREAAQQAFGALFTNPPTKDTASYDILTDYSACPAENPGLNNCVIDAKLRDAIAQAEQGKPVTIQEAMDQGLLDPNRELISPRRTGDHGSIDCYKKGYCYSNIQKLRKARILPLGFEVAALLSDPDKPWKLGDVVKKFEDCTYGPNGITVIPNTAKPYCHLINPNWIIRAPEARCEARVFTPNLKNASLDLRQEECADISTRIVEAKTAEKTKDYFSYCLKEKNVWSFPESSQCPAQFATCETYSNSKTGAASAYLSRTIDTGLCSAENAGCLAYSLEQKTDGAWMNSAEAVVVSPSYKTQGRNRVVHFDDNINTSEFACTAKDEGCSEFFRLNSAGQQEFVYLKKAPAYLGCYDTEPQTASVEWPTTVQEVVNKIAKNEACGAFASVCAPSEVACDAYTPLAGGDAIPGIVGGNGCSAACLGYDTFKQEAAVFSPAKFPLYFVPSLAEKNMKAAGQLCNAAVAGCAEFTNISGLNAGQSGLEYYSAIKRCARPGDGGSAVFYSWEGSATAGYSLQTHTLAVVETNNEVLGSYPASSPAYADDTSLGLTNAFALCDQTLYNNLINNVPNVEHADPDCRALFDKDGAVYYRLLSKTVTVSAACQELRKTVPEFFVDTEIFAQSDCEEKAGLWGDAPDDSVPDAVCRRCTGGGSWQATDPANPTSGACVYKAIDAPSESASCPSTANGCRAYTGNKGNNTKKILNETFETGVPAGWSVPTGAAALKTSANAINVGGNSLEVNSDTLAYLVPQGQIETGASYELTFWARGLPQTLTMYLEQGESKQKWSLTANSLTGAEQAVSFGNTWKEYHVGPALFGGASNQSATLVFDRSKSKTEGPYFLDTVVLTRTVDKAYLIENSWKTAEGYDAPKACFASNQNPAGPFPGAALGCKAYTHEPKEGKETVYITGFQELCRSEAIGCTALYDTYNSTSKEEQVFNVPCLLNNTNTPVAENTACQIVLDGDNLGACTILSGETFCYVSAVTLPAPFKAANLFGSNFGWNAVTHAAYDAESTTIIPRDTPKDAPIYLADKKQHRCGTGAKGCTKVAQEIDIKPDDTYVTSSFKYAEKFLLNNPDRYAGDNGILCRADLTGCGSFSSNGAITYFKDPTLIGNKLCAYLEGDKAPANISGWYIKDTSTPCYPALLNDNTYGLASNASSAYKGFVGLCAPQYDACTELIDPADTTITHPEGTPYYVLFRDDVTARADQCTGASLREGCVLFDKTDNPAKSFSTELTYDKSEEKAKEVKENKDTQVPPQSAPNPSANDANTLLKVDRDRQCSEWLACETAFPQTDDKGKTRQLCYQYAACQATDGKHCTAQVEQQYAQLSDAFLGYNRYVNRDTSWYGEEYTGYSLFNRYQIQDYQYLTFDTDKKEKDLSYIAFRVPDNYFLANDKEKFSEGCIQEPVSTPPKPKTDFTPCGPVLDQGGRCIDGACIYPITGSFPTGLGTSQTDIDIQKQKLTQNICKAFPEETSPYPTTVNKTAVPKEGPDPDQVRKEFVENKPGFASATICQDGVCSCAYTKIAYRDGRTDYWSNATVLDKQSLLTKGICTGGDDDGDLCLLDADCDSGVCSKIERHEKHIGLAGYCLEEDVSRSIHGAQSNERACLTWLPVDVAASHTDIYNFFPEAGYYPVLAYDATSKLGGGEVYCSASTAFAGGAEYDEMNLAHFVKNKPVPDFPGDTEQTIQNNISDVIVWNPKGEDSIKFNSLFYLNSSGWGNESNGGGISCSQIKDKGWGAIFPHYVCGSGATLNQPYTYYSGLTATAFGSVPLSSFLQLWSWKFIGLQAHVLRAELGGSTSDYGYSVYSIKGGGVNSPFALLPETKVDSKTLFHPPRFYQNGQPYKNTGNLFSFTASVDGVGSGDSQTFETGCQLPNNGCTSFVHSSPKENTLTEDQLDTVYFAPLRFPNVSDDFNAPRLLSEDFVIPIHDLRLSDAKSFVFSNLNTAFTQETEKKEFPEYSGLFYGAVWAYMLERDPASKACDGLFSFCDYTGSKAGPFDGTYLYTMKGNAVQDPERNKIHRRYVSVFYRLENAAMTKDGKSGQAPFLDQTGSPGADPATDIDTDNDGRPEAPPKNQYQDPFSAPCYASAGNDKPYQHHDYMAIGMDFNERGEFLGYISRFCEASTGNSGIQLAVLATFKEYCTEFHQVHTANTAIAKSTNKAWTNRVWRGSSFLPINFDAGNSFKIPFKGSTFNRAVERPPFGALTISGSELDEPEQSLVLKKYVFDSAVQGLPYQCKGSGGKSPLFFPTPASIIDKFFTPCQGLLVQYDQQTYPSDSVNLIGITSVFGSETQSVYLKGTGLLRTLFAASFKRYNPLLAPTDTYNKDSEDKSNGANQNLVPPQIYSLHPTRCFGSSNSQSTCTPAEPNNLTIGSSNGVSLPYTDYNQDGIPDEDKNNDGVADSIVAIGTYPAELSFFAFADDNRMPIKRVVVDYGDKSTVVSDQYGFYKNRKPFCESSNDTFATSLGFCRLAKKPKTEPPTLLTCQTDADCPADSTVENPYICVKGDLDKVETNDKKGNDKPDSFINVRFGNLPRSCTPGYFQYFHSYTCSPINYTKLALSGLDPKEQTRIQQTYNLTAESDICVFKPRAQVLDNWGWCNASTKEETGFVSASTGLYGEQFCSVIKELEDLKPWTYYRGNIVIIPN